MMFNNLKKYFGKRIRKNMYLRKGYYITYTVNTPDTPPEFANNIFLLYLNEDSKGNLEAYWEEAIWEDDDYDQAIAKSLQYLKTNISEGRLVDRYPPNTKLKEFAEEYNANEQYYEFNTLSKILKQL